MISTKLFNGIDVELWVWEICKFWFLQNWEKDVLNYLQFERYVNFDFYKTEGGETDEHHGLRDM